MTSQEDVSDCLVPDSCATSKNTVIRRILRFGAYLAFIGCAFSRTGLALAQQSPDTNTQVKIAALNVEMSDALQKVKAIVNQPVTRLPRKKGMSVGLYSPGWFHEGASKPHFPSADVRQTQQFIYDKYPYVTSDLNPGYVFISRELEFNLMTKYFYLDRSLPKKRLSQAEMLEINRLYRIIGRCEQQIAELEQPYIEQVESGKPEGELTLSLERVPKSNYVKAAIGISIVLVVYLIYRRFR